MPTKLEREMYCAVRQYFIEALDCTKAVADLPEEKIKIHLLRNLTKREPDVIGIRSDGRIIVAEGKMLSRGSQPFETCLSQAMSLKVYADYCDVFFPKDEWQALSPHDKKYNRHSVSQRGIGIILVDSKGNCDAIVKHQYNPEADPEKQQEVREAIGDVKNEPIARSPHLSPEAAAAANSLLSVLSVVQEEIVTEAMSEVFGGKAKSYAEPFEDISGWTVSDGTDGCILSQHYNKDTTVGVEIDPFGRYTEDGKASLWIFVDIELKQLRHVLANRPPVFGTHIYFGEPEVTMPIFDIRVEMITSDKDLQTGIQMAHRVEVLGRDPEGLKAELIQLLSLAKTLKSSVKG